jgi:hypothetical protein
MPRVILSESRAARLKLDLRIPQLRILRVLGEGGSLTRAKINQRCGFSEQSGTIVSAMNGVREGSSSGAARPGLLALGLVVKEDLDIDGVVEMSYIITSKGREALELHAGIKLPEMRNKDSTTNKRYLDTKE